MGTKVCSKCGVEKDVGEFYKDKKGRGGLSSTCKVCAYSHHRAWVENNPAKVKEYSKRYYDKHRDDRLEYSKAYYWENRDAALERGREYYGANKDRAIEYRKRYYVSNKDAIDARNVEYKRRHRAKFNELDRVWRAANKDVVRDMERRKSERKIGQLEPSYVKDQLRKLGISNPSPELIEAKREQLALYRATKQLYEAIKDANESDRVDEGTVGDESDE